MTGTSDESQVLDQAIQGAHAICNKLFLFEAARMSEEDIRVFLEANQVVDKKLQDEYLDYLHLYRISSS